MARPGNRRCRSGVAGELHRVAPRKGHGPGPNAAIGGKAVLAPTGLKRGPPMDTVRERSRSATKTAERWRLPTDSPGPRLRAGRARIISLRIGKADFSHRQSAAWPPGTWYSPSAAEGKETPVPDRAGQHKLSDPARRVRTGGLRRVLSPASLRLRAGTGYMIVRTPQGHLAVPIEVRTRRGWRRKK